MCFPLFHYIKDQFDYTGDPEFVIDVEQIIAHRVYGATKAACYAFELEGLPTQ